MHSLKAPPPLVTPLGKDKPELILIANCNSWKSHLVGILDIDTGQDRILYVGLHFGCNLYDQNCSGGN